MINYIMPSVSVVAVSSSCGFSIYALLLDLTKAILTLQEHTCFVKSCMQPVCSTQEIQRP